MNPRKIVLATRNPGKIAEMRRLLNDHGIMILSMSDFPDAPEVEETADTLRGNAALKAQTIHSYTGLTSLADDTGLEVRILDGRPGVFSARFAGENATDADNRRHLLALLTDTEDRQAQFRTVVAVCNGIATDYFEGICTGRITHEERGTAGFGYDCIFEPEGGKRTFAELNGEEKNRISHRGRALAAYVSSLTET